jgi:hypothetical protein
VAWTAIVGGALAAAGLMLVLTPLGAALGFAWAAPWNDGGFDHGLAVVGAIWLIVVQWISSGVGGYLTGRLRLGWPGAHTHEVFFRDTVHGFLAWALAAFLGTFLLAAAVSHIAAGAGAPENFSMASSVGDSLFRSASPSASVTDQDRAESRRIIVRGVRDGQIPEADRNYLAELVADRTGVSVADADARIAAALARQKTAVSNAARVAFFTALSLLIGAFIAAAAGALGGIHRDAHYETGSLNP